MRFADDAAGFFGGDGKAAHDLDPAEREALQQAALAYRLERLLPQLEPLRALAETQGLDASVSLDDAPRLFYPHSLYKSYDHAWLTQLEFDRMTAFANKLVTRPLAVPDGVQFANIDAWLAWLERDHGLDIAHSTGTTGRMSLVFRDCEEAALRLARIDMMRREWHRSHGLPEDESDLRVVWPGPRTGRSALQKVIAHWSDTLADEAQIACLFDDDLGADYELYVVGARAANERGQMELPQPTPYIESKLQEAERRSKDRDWNLARFVEQVAQAMSGHRLMVLGGPLSVMAVAQVGLDAGIAGQFAPTSFSCRLGGLKGFPAPEGMEEAITRFIGSNHTMSGYGMTELNAGFLGCEAGRFHVPPWIVPYVLDPANGWAPRPREGVQEGRAGFLDIATQHNWGGLATADHVVIDYGPCACGRRSPSVEGDIKRVQDRDGDMSFTPATEEALAAVQEALRG